jgi:hypothetical protein
MTRRIVFLLALAMTACESDLQRVDRLRAEQTLAEVDVQRWESAITPANQASASLEERIRVDTATPPDWMLDSLSAAKNRRDLARRELSRFGVAP